MCHSSGRVKSSCDQNECLAVTTTATAAVSFNGRWIVESCILALKFMKCYLMCGNCVCACETDFFYSVTVHMVKCAVMHSSTAVL